MDIERELAPFDSIAGVFHRIAGERRKVDVTGLGGDVERQFLRERVEATVHLNRCRALDVRGQIEFARLLGRHGADAAGDIREIRRVVGLDVEVGEIHVAAREFDVPDRDRQRIARRRLRARARGQEPHDIERRIRVDDEAREEFVEVDAVDARAERLERDVHGRKRK